MSHTSTHVKPIHSKNKVHNSPMVFFHWNTEWQRLQCTEQSCTFIALTLLCWSGESHGRYKDVGGKNYLNPLTLCLPVTRAPIEFRRLFRDTLKGSGAKGFPDWTRLGHFLVRVAFYFPWFEWIFCSYLIPQLNNIHVTLTAYVSYEADMGSFRPLTGVHLAFQVMKVRIGSSTLNRIKQM